MKSKLKVGFVSSASPLDRRSWSGTNYQIYKALSNEFETVEILTYNNKFSKILGIINKISMPLFNKRYNHHHSTFRAKIQSKGIQKLLKKSTVDVIFCCAGSTEIAYLETAIPIVYFSDTSVGQFSNYYDTAKNHFEFSNKEANRVEQKALNNSAKIIYPTNWAKDFTQNFYKIPEHKIFQIHLGPNIDKQFIQYHPRHLDKQSPFRILFLGVYWERKGGDIVVESYQQLKKEGYLVELTICGIIPPVSDEEIKVIPFLDKNNDKDLIKLQELLNQTDLLFVPSRAECYGIVFNEAAAFGIPVLSTKTGGIPEIVKDHFNGYTLPLTCTTKDYTTTIKKMIENKDLYSTLSENARQQYNEENNWKIFGEKLRKILESTVIVDQFKN